MEGGGSEKEKVKKGERKEGERGERAKKGRGGSKYAPSDSISYNSPGAAEKAAAERGVWSHDRR